MKCFRDSQNGETAASVKLSALIREIMSSSESSSRYAHASSFPPPNTGGPNLEGTNVGASMIIRRGSVCGSGEMNDSCGINIYINNNIQGVNNSILIGSRSYMGDPGVWMTLNESKLERWFSKKISSNSPALGFYVLLIFVTIVAFVMIFFRW